MLASNQTETSQHLSLASCPGSSSTWPAHCLNDFREARALESLGWIFWNDKSRRVKESTAIINIYIYCKPHVNICLSIVTRHYVTSKLFHQWFARLTRDLETCSTLKGEEKEPITPSKNGSGYDVIDAPKTPTKEEECNHVQILNLPIVSPTNAWELPHVVDRIWFQVVRCLTNCSRTELDKATNQQSMQSCIVQLVPAPRRIEGTYDHPWACLVEAIRRPRRWQRHFSRQQRLSMATFSDTLARRPASLLQQNKGNQNCWAKWLQMVPIFST